MKLSLPPIHLPRCAVFLCLLVLGSATSAKAAVLAYEGFDYSTGNLIGQNGGTGFATSGSWSAYSGSSAGIGTENVIAGSLDYSNLATTGNQANVTPTGTAPSNTLVGAMRTLNASYSTGTVYLSFLANLDEGTRFFGISLYNGANEQLLIGKQSGGTNWAVSGGVLAAAGVSTVAATLDTTFLFVVRIDFNASSTNERIRLYLNPPAGTEPGVAQVNVLTTTSFSFDTLRIGAGYDNGSATTAKGAFDEIRLGTTWADVTPIPEPGSLWLLAGGLIFSFGAIGSKRRRRLGSV